MKCKKCGYSFHYCSSCDQERYFDNRYCSNKCMEKSYEFLKAKGNLKELMSSLNKDQQKKFYKSMNDYIKFEYEFDEIIEKVK